MPLKSISPKTINKLYKNFENSKVLTNKYKTRNLIKTVHSNNNLKNKLSIMIILNKSCIIILVICMCFCVLYYQFNIKILNAK